MQSDTFMLYKLMILYMLNKVKFPLTNAQLTSFILRRNIQIISIYNRQYRNLLMIPSLL